MPCTAPAMMGVIGPECADAIPIMSEWGLVVLGLLFFVGGKVYFGSGSAFVRANADR